MKIERYRSFEGIQIRAFYKKDKALFEHCAGDSSVSSKKQREVEMILFLHGVVCIETVDHESI